MSDQRHNQGGQQGRPLPPPQRSAQPASPAMQPVAQQAPPPAVEQPSVQQPAPPVVQSQVPAPVATPDTALANELAELKSQLAAAQGRLQTVESQRDDLRQQLSRAPELGSEQGAFGPKDMSTVTDQPTWPFDVSALNRPELPKKNIRAVDEGEAIRLYALRTRDPKKEGQPLLDPTSCRFKVECTDPQREALHRKQYEDKRSTMTAAQFS